MGVESRGLPRLEAELTSSQCTEPEGNGKEEAASRSGFQPRLRGEGRWAFTEMRESGAGRASQRHSQTSPQETGQAGAHTALELWAVM